MAVAELSGAAKSQARREKSINQGYWSLVWWKFKRNRLAVLGGIIVLTFYVVCGLFAEFFSPYLLEYKSDYLEARPQWPQFIDNEGNFHLRPFVYGLEEKVDIQLRKRTYEIDETKQYPLYFFVPGQPYKLMGLIPMERHFFGTDPATPEAHAFIFGTDSLGRDMLTRIIYGGRLSLLVGLIGQILTLLFGAVMGVAAGHFGGATDNIIMRVADFLSAFPDIPLFMALAAAIPPQWSPIWVYFMLTIILAFVRWPGLARQVRGLVLSLREREYVLAARSFGAGDRRIMFRHLLPGTLSHIIVIATLAIPGMILAETALSWLGLGLRPPLTSWGVLMQQVTSVRAINFAPWLLIPVPFIIIAVMGFNLLGDGLRDALDPYSGR